MILESIAPHVLLLGQRLVSCLYEYTLNYRSQINQKVGSFLFIQNHENQQLVFICFSVSPLTDSVDFLEKVNTKVGLCLARLS